MTSQVERAKSQADLGEIEKAPITSQSRFRFRSKRARITSPEKQAPEASPFRHLWLITGKGVVLYKLMSWHDVQAIGAIATSMKRQCSSVLDDGVVSLASGVSGRNSDGESPAAKRSAQDRSHKPDYWLTKQTMCPQVVMMKGVDKRDISNAMGCYEREVGHPDRERLYKRLELLAHCKKCTNHLCCSHYQTKTISQHARRSTPRAKSTPSEF